jgi:nitrogen regulatory protein PII
MFSPATKVVFIIERLIQDQVVDMLEEAGAKGYTIVPGSGQGEHHRRRGSGRAAIVNDFSIVRIEVIMADGEKARAVSEAVAKTYFEEHPGIVYVSDVEVIRADRF